MDAWLMISIVGFVLIAAAVFCMFRFTAKDMRRCRIQIEDVSLDDAITAREMMVDFLERKIREAGRRCDECKEAGCDGSLVLRDSMDIAKAIMLAHEVGGRLVLRKSGEGDVEDTLNTVLEVKKKLSEMDMERAKRLQRKQRGRL